MTFSYPGSERVALRGVSLQISPGEVVTLARTFFRDAPLVILDEPTAALDAKAEHELFARIGEAWALLLIHNITATTSARAAGSAGIDPGLIPFTAVLGLIRSHVAAETPCRHCGHRPASPLASLNTAILALPRHRQGRQRTSGRTAAERRTRHTEEVTYTIDITKSNLPKWDSTQLWKLKGSEVLPYHRRCPFRPAKEEENADVRPTAGTLPTGPR